MKIEHISERLDEDEKITPFYRTQRVEGEAPYREYLIGLTRNQYRQLTEQEPVPEEQNGEMVAVTEENFSEVEVANYEDWH